ncbi:MAG: amidohydrolase family protein [Dehalococcoidia bacterium]|nr:amidohydrolase family protein [Dehalococcoidia bacterium]
MPVILERMKATLFHNAHVLTMNAGRPRTEAVLVVNGIIAAVGDVRRLQAGAPGDLRVVDCQGGVLAPAFIDAHCHLLATAARTLSVDCSPAAVSSITEIQGRLREAASRAKAGAWIRAAGYDESRLAERRHPTRRDLDAAASQHPVRLLHRSGHAVVLNTGALAAAGITAATPAPPGGVIDRFADDGEPSGLLLEMNELVDAFVPALPYDELATAVEAVAHRYLAAGVTAICDATHTNDEADRQLFARLQREGRLPLDVTLMEGASSALAAFHGGRGASGEGGSSSAGPQPRPLSHEGRAAGATGLRGRTEDALRPEAGDAPSEDGAPTGEAAFAVARADARASESRWRHVKIMLRELGGSLVPDEHELTNIVRELHGRGRDAAVHAVEERAVRAAVDAIAAAVAERPRAHRHRIEHAALLPAGAAVRMASLGISVVTQPAFVFEHGDRYLRDVPSPEHDALYALGDLLRARVRVAASSDAPVGPLEPLAGVRAAMTRRTRDGARVAPAQAVGFAEALAMWTSSAAEVCGLETTRGRIAPGLAADLVLLSQAGVAAELVGVWQRGERV